MTVATLSHTTWNYTCKICSILRKAFYLAFVGLIAFGESAGRARAANELARQGYYKEAKALMLDHPWRDEK
jgi:hypothetical protein